MEKHPIDQIFRDKLGDFEKNPPVGLLNQVHQEVAFRSRVRRITRLRTIVSIAAALVLAMMAGWYSLTPEQYPDDSISNLIQPKILSGQTDPGKELQVAQTANNQQLYNQQNKAPDVAAGSAGKTRSVIVPGGKAKSPVTAEGKALLANHTPVSEPAQVTSADQQPVETNEGKKSGPTSKANKKGAELPYFADAYAAPVGQESASAKGSWRIKAELSPMFSPINQSASAGAVVSKSYNTVCGGMIAAYKVNDKLSIGTGIRFSQMKQGTHTAYALNAKSGITYLEPVEKSGSIAGDVSLNLPSKSSIVYYNGIQANNNNVASSDISQDFKYLEIPVQATYKFLDKKLSFGVTGGISTNILIGNNASMAENGIKLSSGRTQNLRDVIYSGSAGLELGYGLAKNLMLTVEPRIKQYMHSVSSNDQINYKPLQMGIFTGITYSFN